MKQVTNEFKDAIRTNGRQLDTIITIDNIPFTKENFNNIIPKFNTNLFKSIMKGVEIDSNFYILKNSKINVKSGVLINNEYEYIDYGNYSVYKEPEINEDTKSWVTTVYDKILDSMIDYDLVVSYPISIRNYWVAIFNRLSWDISGIPETFTNSSKMINQDVHSGIGYTFRDVLDELCTISAVFLMDKNGIPTIMTPTETNQIIDETYLKDTNVTVKEKVFFNSLVFARAEESDNIYRKDDTSIEENGLHEFRISDNQLLSTNDRVDYIDELWEYLKTFEYYSFDIDTIGVMLLEPIDRFTISANENNYSTILLNDTTTISQGLTENMYSDSPEETETEYKYADTTDRKLNQTYILVDKQNQKIESVVSEVGQYDERITNVEQSVEGLTTQVSEIANLIREISGNNSLIIEDASANYLKSLSIKGQISLLFGNNGKTYGIVPYAEILYPSSTLFGKNMNLIVESGEETQTIKLPFTFLNYINNEVCDEFKIEDGKASVIRRVGINSNMEKYQLETEVIEDLGELNILLKEGSNKLYLQCFNSAIYSASYMIKNEFTDEFATKVELNSAITQTAEEINLEVSKKVDENEVVSSINLSSEEVKINSNKISLEGYTTINENFKINTDGDMECNNAQINGTIKGSIFKGTNDESIYMTIGDNPDDTSTLKTNNCIQILRPDGTNMLTIGTRFWGSGNLNELVFEAPARFFSFYSTIDDSKVQANAFVATDIVSGARGNIGQLSVYENLSIGGNATIYGDLTVEGTKNRLVTTENYGNRLLNAYETATPYFGDIGSDTTDENGYCKIIIEDIFKETIELDNYKVFIQECGDGKLYVKKYDDYFEVIGTPNLEFDWEIKAIQKGYKDVRLKEAIIKEINNEEVINK